MRDTLLDFIFHTLKPCFKSLNNTKLNSLAKAIACVALGLRASHLVDIAYLDLENAKSLLFNLRKHTQCKSLILVQFKDRFTFLCNKNRLKQHSNSTLNKWFYLAVDGNQPVKLTEPPIHLLNWLENNLKPFLKSSDQFYYYSAIVPTFMVCLTGWTLEYPVIYTTHSITDGPEEEFDEWEPRSNCLGSQLLNVIQVWLDDHMLLSFSFPLDHLSTQESNQLQSDLQQKMDKRLQQIYNLPNWLSHTHAVLKLEQVKLDRFAL